MQFSRNRQKPGGQEVDELTDYLESISPMNRRISRRTSSTCFCPLIALPVISANRAPGICGLLHDHATLMAASGQCAQAAMQIDQRFRNDLLFRHVHSKVSSPLVSAIFGLLDFPSWRGLYCVRLSALGDSGTAAFR